MFSHMCKELTNCCFHADPNERSLEHIKGIESLRRQLQHVQKRQENLRYKLVQSKRKVCAAVIAYSICIAEQALVLARLPLLAVSAEPAILKYLWHLHDCIRPCNFVM